MIKKTVLMCFFLACFGSGLFCQNSLKLIDKVFPKMSLQSESCGYFGYYIDVWGDKFIIGSGDNVFYFLTSSKKGSVYENIEKKEESNYTSFGSHVSICGNIAVSSGAVKGELFPTLFFYKYINGRWVEYKEIKIFWSGYYHINAIHLTKKFVVISDAYKGKVYLVYYNYQNGIKYQSIKFPEEDVHGFGMAVSMSDDYLFISMPGNPYEMYYNYEGKVYVYKRVANKWIIDSIISVENASYFGGVLSSSCNKIMIGAKDAVYIFSKKKNIWKSECSLEVDKFCPGGVGSRRVGLDKNNAFFVNDEGILSYVKYSRDAWMVKETIKLENAISLSVHNNNIIVGAFLDSTKGKRAGAAYILKLIEGK